MYAGRIVEQRDADDIFRAPSHPYTSGLIASLPLLGARAAHGRQRLTEIAGVVPSITAFPSGCRFNPRCSAGDGDLPRPSSPPRRRSAMTASCGATIHD